MFNTLYKLISKHYYTNEETAQSKVDVCFAMGKITEEQYSTLVMLIEQVYSIN